MKREKLKIHGWINLDKPHGMTSTQAVGKIRFLLNAAKAGHAGTLDPLATGILPIALGEATKTLPFVVDRDKEYEFAVTWGEQRDTDDGEGAVIAQSDTRPQRADIEAALPAFTGRIKQLPPRYSAIKIDGQRAYDLARAGEDVELAPRDVTIHTLALTGFERDCARFTMECGKGTYVRSLARDLALKLGTVGYVSALRRTRVGPFSLENSISLDNFAELCQSPDHTDRGVLPLTAALDGIPALPLSEAEATKITHGQVVPLISKDGLTRLQQAGLNPQNSDPSPVYVTCRGKALAIVNACGVDLHPVRVFQM